MRYALINPPWTFDGSIYFGCREAHLPLEFGYAKALLERDGHDALIVDGQLDRLSPAQMRECLAVYAPDVAVVTTAPSYLFWRCAPPELRLPQEVVRDLRRVVPRIVAIGPHGSTTPETTLSKLGADAVVVGECEDILPRLAAPVEQWSRIDSLCTWADGVPQVRGGTHSTDMSALPALNWP